MSSTSDNLPRKPRVVALGDPKYVDSKYLASFTKDFNYSVLDAPDRTTTQALLPENIQKYGPIDAFIVRMGTPPYEPFDEDLLSALVPSCKIIASASAGYNEFDVEWMAREGIWFCNTVNAVAEATSDMAVFVILAVLRNTSNAERSARSGAWRNAPVLYYNRHQLSPEDEALYGVTYCNSLHELLYQSDIVSVNCPLNKETTSLIGQAEFAAMKDLVSFINTARGPVVEEESLIDALVSGKVARAGLDVFDNEPSLNEYFRISDRVIMQPHLRGLTDKAFQKAETKCFENIRAFFQTGRPNSPVIEIKSR